MTMPSPEGQRLPPVLPVQAYKTFQVVAPLRTHWRAATCEEVECDAYRNGFRLYVDEATELGQAQADYVRHKAGRKFAEHRDPGSSRTVFTFPPGTLPFASAEHTSHKVRIEREELFVTRPGDWRGNPTGERPYQHTKAEFWTEEFAEHQGKLADRVNRG